jgi:hypothetical protein
MLKLSEQTARRKTKNGIKKIGRHKKSEGTKHRAFALKMNFDAQVREIPDD